MKTKIISIVVMLMMACNVMAQDYLTVFFKDGKTERHLLSLVQNISVTKYDKDSISHSDYQCQQIVLKNAIYTYPISEIDSITFNKVDESQIIENVTSTLTEIHQLLEKDAFSYNFTEYADIIRNNPGVSDAQVIEDKLVVKIKDWRNIVYMHPTDFQEVNDESLNNKYRISPVSARKHKSENVNSAINVAIVNQFSHAEERKVIVEKCEFLKSQFEELGFNADYITDLDLAFFNDKIFDYDIIMLNTHGGYLLDKHWLLTSEEMGETSSSIIAHVEGFINDFKNHLDEDIDDVTYYCIDEERDGEKKWIYYVAVSEDYIKQRPKKFNSGTLIYANVCESLKDNDNLANIFINKGASSYLGYDKKSVYGWTAGPYFYDLALNGLSIQKAYSSIPKNYNPEDSKYKASLRLLPNGDSSPHFITKTITAPADEVSEEIQNDGSHLFTFYGYTSLYYYTIDYITMGFQFSTDSEMKNAQDAPVVNSFTYVDNKYGNYKFYRTLSIEPGTTVHYRAYTYDGLYYNYGEIRSFTLEKADPLTLSQNSISLTAGNSTTVEITSGNGSYTASVDKPTIATATLSGTTITIKGEAKGTAKVTVKDKSGQTAEIKVTVWDNLTLSQSSVGLYPGNSTTVEITNGSGHYSVSVDKPAVATASLSGSKITIKGVGVGSAVVTVTDTSTNQTAKINVTVSSAPTLVVSNSSVNLIVGGSSTVEITSGSGSYEISNSNTRVVQTVLEGAKITLTAKSEGNAVVTVKDKVTGQTASISVTVNSIANLVLSQSNVNLAIGAEAIVEIVSGSGDYSVAVDKPAVATATLSGTKITIKGIATGTANVTVKDKSGQTAEIKVTVNSSSESYAVYNAGTLTFYHDQLKNSRGGSVYVLNTGENYPGWYDHDNINKVVFDKSFADARPTSTYRWFYEMNNLTSIEGIKNLNTSEVTNMYAMFAGCESLTSLDVSKFNTANVTDFSFIFWCCENLASLDVSNFKTEKVTDMLAMFYDCKNLISLDVSNFDTRNVTNMAGMFYGCESLTSLNVSNFNTANVTDMSFMFNLCENLTSLDVSNFDTKNVTDMAGMFQLCSNLTSLDVSNFNTANVTDMSWMFYSCTNLTSLDVKNFKTGNVTKMYAMFYGCESLTSLNVSNFNTANVTDMSFMFNHCENLTSLDVSNFDTKNVTDMAGMFQHCSNLTSLNVSNFNTANVTDMSFMFNHCENLTSLDVSNFDTKNVTDMTAMFQHCSNLTSLNVSKFNTANVTDMSGMFNYCENLTSLDVSKFNTANATGMAGMFQCCSNLTSLNVSNFNTANVTDMSGMFNHCENLTSLDVSKFNTANVTDMRVMFQCCSNLTSLDVSNFDTRNVTDMSWMFYDCESLTSLNVSSFNTEKVTNMCYMFYWCEKLTSLDVSNFDTRNVTDMRYMFFNCWNLNTLDVSNFIMAVCEDSECMFGYCDGLNSLAVSFTMENLNEDACAYVGYYEPCSIIAPDGFDFGVDTSGESFTWKSGYFKLGSGNTSILSFTVNGVSFKMVAVEGGTFMMGASDYDYEALSIDKPQHQVTLSSYYIGQVEVTQELWNAVMGTNPSHFKSSNKLPVECVSWDDCQRFIAKLNNLTGETFSLPTEAQWEFAARGGNNSNDYTYSGSNSLDFVAWYDDNSGGKTHNVANKVPNELGLYDMSGNVAEWCQDYLGDYNSNSQTNPSGPSSGSTRINRGGHWGSVSASCLVYKRKYAKPGDKYNSIGLRLVL